MNDILSDMKGAPETGFESLMMRGAEAVTSAMLAGSTVVLVLGLAATLHKAVSPAPERIQAGLVQALQDEHGAYAGGISEGLTMAGARIPLETRALLDAVVPDMDRNPDLRLQALRTHGLEAGMSGQVGISALHDYARLIGELPSSVAAFSAQAENKMGIAGEAGPRLARLAVLTGLLSETGAVEGVEMEAIIRTLALEVPVPEVEVALIRIAEGAARLRDMGDIRIPEPSRLTAHLSDSISREMGALVQQTAERPSGP